MSTDNSPLVTFAREVATGVYRYSELMARAREALAAHAQAHQPKTDTVYDAFYQRDSAAQAQKGEPVTQYQLRRMNRVTGEWGEWENVSAQGYEDVLADKTTTLRFEGRKLYTATPAQDTRCPYIVSSDEGTSHCRLAERDGKDAARYRYWRKHHGWTGYFDDGLTNSESEPEIDAAIDAAMAREGG